MKASEALAPAVPACLFLLLLLGAPLEAQDTGLQSGPAAGMQLTPVPVYAPTGPHKGETFDAAKVIHTSPGVLMFVHTINREVAPVIRGLDSLALQYGVLGFKSFTVRLGADRTEIEEATGRQSTAMGMHNPMVVSTDGIEGPGNYALNRKAYLTVVLVNKGKVHRSIAITDTGQKDVPRLRKWIEEVCGPLPRTSAELMARLPDDPQQLKQLVASLHEQVQRQAEQLQQRRGRREMGRRRADRNRRGEGRRDAPPTSRPQLAGKVPEDAELQGLMRAMINKLNTEEDVDELLGRVAKRVGQDTGLRTEAVEGFKRLLSTTYGTDYARKRWQEYVQKHDQPHDKAHDKKKL